MISKEYFTGGHKMKKCIKLISITALAFVMLFGLVSCTLSTRQQNQALFEMFL